MKMLRPCLVIGAIASVGLVSPAIATPASGFSTEQLAKGVYDPMHLTADKDGKWDLMLKTKDKSDVYVVRNTITPGGESGLAHTSGPQSYSGDPGRDYCL
jgi:hypothetical protein